MAFVNATAPVVTLILMTNRYRQSIGTHFAINLVSGTALAAGFRDMTKPVASAIPLKMSAIYLQSHEAWVICHVEMDHKPLFPNPRVTLDRDWKANSCGSSSLGVGG